MEGIRQTCHYLKSLPRLKSLVDYAETMWLTQQQMADLFQTSRTNVVEHIRHIYEECEFDAKSTCRKFRQVRKEGNHEISREMPYYNLDMIISLGYRVKIQNSD